MYNKKLENISKIDLELLENNSYTIKDMIFYRALPLIGSNFMNYLVTELDNLKNLINDPTELENIFNNRFSKLELGYIGRNTYITVLFDSNVNEFYFIQNEKKVYLTNSIGYLNFYKGLFEGSVNYNDFENFVKKIRKEKEKINRKVQKTKKQYLNRLNYVLSTLEG